MEERQKKMRKVKRKIPTNVILSSADQVHIAGFFQVRWPWSAPAAMLSNKF